MADKFLSTPFLSARDEVRVKRSEAHSPQAQSPSYQLAFLDHDFLLKEALRPVRLQLELLKPELIQQEQGVDATIVVFGSARIAEKSQAQKKVDEAKARLAQDPQNAHLKQRVKTAESLLAKSHYYDEARELGRVVSQASRQNPQCHFVIMTGGGPGIMQGANHGAHDADAKSIGLGIVLPMEEAPNPYVTPELSFHFHYFAIRKMHFLLRARALVAFPGGFGTLDELFETLTLMQTRKIRPVPVILFGKKYWDKIINFEAMVDEGVILPEDLNLIQYVETAQEAWHLIAEFYHMPVVR